MHFNSDEVIIDWSYLEIPSSGVDYDYYYTSSGRYVIDNTSSRMNIIYIEEIFIPTTFVIFTPLGLLTTTFFTAYQLSLVDKGKVGNLVGGIILFLGMMLYTSCYFSRTLLYTDLSYYNIGWIIILTNLILFVDN